MHPYRSAELGRDPPDSWYSQTALPREVARLLWWGLAAKTRKTYVTPTKLYSAHCAINGSTPFFPVIVNSLASWIAHLSTRRVKAKTIKAYLTGVRSAHVDMGYEDLTVFHNPQLQRIIAGIRRLRGEAGIKERRPIIKDLLLQVLKHISQEDEAGATLYAAFCLAFAAFLRVGEFIYTARDRKSRDFE